MPQAEPDVDHARFAARRRTPVEVRARHVGLLGEHAVAHSQQPGRSNRQLGGGDDLDVAALRIVKRWRGQPPWVLAQAEAPEHCVDASASDLGPERVLVRELQNAPGTDRLAQRHEEQELLLDRRR